MTGIWQNFEQMAMNFSTPVVIGLGAGLVLAGLFIWLGGLGFGKALAVAIGASVAGVLGFFIIEMQTTKAAILVAIAAAVAGIFHHKVIIIMAAGLALILGFSILGGSFVFNENNMNSRIKLGILEVPASKWLMILAPAVIILVAGLFLERLTVAVTCAAGGTILVFAGLILLLLYKGAEPINYINQRQMFFLGVIGAMTLFGSGVQLLLFRRVKTSKEEPPQKPKKVHKSAKQVEAPVTKPKSWRTS